MSRKSCSQFKNLQHGNFISQARHPPSLPYPVARCTSAVAALSVTSSVVVTSLPTVTTPMSAGEASAPGQPGPGLDQSESRM